MKTRISWLDKLKYRLVGKKPPAHLQGFKEFEDRLKKEQEAKRKPLLINDLQRSTKTLKVKKILYHK